MGRTQRTKRDPAQPTTNERTNERASGRTTTSALLSTFPTQSNPFFSVFGKKNTLHLPVQVKPKATMVEHNKNDSHTGKHSAVNERSMEKRGKRTRLSKADSRGHGSGKCDLRGELKKCEGKSIKDLAV